MPILFLMVLFGFFCNPVWAKSYTVAGDSMFPTLKPGDVVDFIDRPPKQLQRGALVAIHFSSRKRKMVKRLIAVAGDKVEFIQGRLKLNGVWLETSWWPIARRLNMLKFKLLTIQLTRYKHIIPADSALVMGDNTQHIFDSGDYGSLSYSQILGEIVLIKE